MKRLTILTLLCLGSYFYAQKKEFDPKLLGCYKGSETNQQLQGLSKYWVSCRLENGKSILLFIGINKNGGISQFTENGSWWSSNGKYYELHDVDNVTDVYEYEKLENGDVKFKSIELMGKPDTSYEFIDYKLEDK